MWSLQTKIERPGDVCEKILVDDVHLYKTENKENGFQSPTLHFIDFMSIEIFSVMLNDLFSPHPIMKVKFCSSICSFACPTLDATNRYSRVKIICIHNYWTQMKWLILSKENLTCQHLLFTITGTMWMKSVEPTLQQLVLWRILPYESLEEL